jgi:hypothetical protein
MNIWQKLFAPKKATIPASGQTAPPVQHQPPKQDIQTESVLNKPAKHTKRPNGPIKINPSAIVSVEIGLPEIYLQKMRSGNKDSDLSAQFFRAINPTYPADGLTFSLFSTPSDIDGHVAAYTKRVGTRIESDKSISCVIQLRALTLRIDGQMCRVDVAVCTIFKIERPDDPQEVVIADDKTSTLYH